MVSLWSGGGSDGLDVSGARWFRSLEIPGYLTKYEQELKVFGDYAVVRQNTARLEVYGDEVALVVARRAGFKAEDIAVALDVYEEAEDIGALIAFIEKDERVKHLVIFGIDSWTPFTGIDRTVDTRKLAGFQQGSQLENIGDYLATTLWKANE